MADGELARIRDGIHHDPHTALGRHRIEGRDIVRAYIPHAASVELVELGEPLSRLEGTDFFEWRGPLGRVPELYQFRWQDATGRVRQHYDPYAFEPLIELEDLQLFATGRHRQAYRFLGAQVTRVNGIRGVQFATWAPNAGRVSVVGEFNRWDGRRHPMRCRGESGVWELFIPGMPPGAIYKFEVRAATSGQILLKSDPYGRSFELRPSTASIVVEQSSHEWGDGDWLKLRAASDWLHEPLSIYEVHLGSWRRGNQNEFLDYRTLAHQLVPHVQKLGFTHLQLLPISEHPFDGSWGYQTTGFYAPTSRHGTPEDFCYFVDYCHRHGVGVILDWVVAHFPKDGHGLANFDGTAVYEHHDARLAEHPDWGTLIFNYGRHEVLSFLLSNADFWCSQFHVDGLRADAVASMLYLDYSRNDDQWIPNIYGGRENLEAIAFLKEVNEWMHQEYPGAVVIAEKSTDWPQVSRPTYVGGLGFSMKWNMGWMHDTLSHLARDPVHRKYHHEELTFGLLYAFNENFVLPLSHDEVVHGKGSLLAKLPGDDWQRFANLRLLYTFMLTHPGKKLLFMGSELAPFTEWSHDGQLDWMLLEDPIRAGCFDLLSDLLHLYRDHPALYRNDFDSSGFEWIDCNDNQQSVLSFIRRDRNSELVVILNFTPVVRTAYRVGVPREGVYFERVNSDAACYGGSNVGNLGRITSTPTEWMGRAYSLELTVPPLAGLILELQ